MRDDGERSSGPSNVSVLNVSASGGAGGQVEVAGTIEGIRKGLTGVQGCLKDAWSLDVIEGDDALKRAEGDCAADKDYFRKRIEEIKKRKDAALLALETLIKTHFEPKAEVVKNLMDNYSTKWDTFMKDVKTQQDVIENHLKLDSWESEGAKAHKKAVEGQKAAMIEFQSLAKDNANGTSQIAQVNGAIFLVMQQTLTNLALKMGADNTPAKTGEDYYGRTYYQRSDTAAARIEGVNTWAEKLVEPYGSDWSGTAEEIQSALDTVISMPANLMKGGIWPEAKSDGAKDARTTNLGDHTQEQMNAASGDGSAKGTLDK